MSILVAVDPDTVAPGVAIFKGGVLVSAQALPVNDALAFVAGFLSPLGNPPLRKLVCEMPQQYRGIGRSKDFLKLASVVGRFEQTCFTSGAVFQSVAPATWKGQVPKGVMSRRIWGELSASAWKKSGGWGDGERGKVQKVSDRQLRALEAPAELGGRGVASGALSDVLDAVGIGLWALGRLKNRRT